MTRSRNRAGLGINKSIWQHHLLDHARGCDAVVCNGDFRFCQDYLNAGVLVWQECCTMRSLIMVFLGVPVMGIILHNIIF